MLVVPECCMMVDVLLCNTPRIWRQVAPRASTSGIEPHAWKTMTISSAGPELDRNGAAMDGFECQEDVYCLSLGSKKGVEGIAVELWFDLGSFN